MMWKEMRILERWGGGEKGRITADAGAGPRAVRDPYWPHAARALGADIDYWPRRPVVLGAESRDLYNMVEGEMAANGSRVVDFYLDTACPWSWRTSVWMREVQKVRDVDVHWKFFSLEVVNKANNLDAPTRRATWRAATRSGRWCWPAPRAATRR